MKANTITAKLISIIGDESDLICKCGNKKARMSAYCLQCKAKFEPLFLKKFKPFRQRKIFVVFTCFGCKKTLVKMRGYVTNNLLYLCEECYQSVERTIK